tara:strand:- start:1225 stop:1392 length:168 start_codon:yes stop_codon:yes gene_type:complete
MLLKTLCAICYMKDELNFDEKTVNHYKKLYDYKKIHVNSCDTKSCKGHADILVHI